MLGKLLMPKSGNEPREQWSASTTPDTDRSVLKSKKDWADEWDVEKMRFNYWENKLRSDGMLVSVERGAILLPLRDLPDGSKKSYAKAAATEGGTTLKFVQVAVHGYNLRS